MGGRLTGRDGLRSGSGLRVVSPVGAVRSRSPSAQMKHPPSARGMEKGQNEVIRAIMNTQ